MKIIKLNNSINVAHVDDADYDKLIVYRWREHSCGYAHRSLADGTPVFMEHDIMGSPPFGMMVDHIDRNKLNNQKGNLRFADHSTNKQNRKLGSHNTTGFRGVFKEHRTGKYYARVKWSGNNFQLGTFINAEDAARAYDRKALELYGPNAATNFKQICNQSTSSIPI